MAAGRAGRTGRAPIVAVPQPTEVDAARRQLSRRAWEVGLLMRNCVALIAASVTLVDPGSAAAPAGRALLAVLAGWSGYRLLSRSARLAPTVVDYLLVLAVCLAIPVIVTDPGFHTTNSAPLAIAGTAVISLSVSVPPRCSLPLTLGVAAAYACGGAAVIGWARVGDIAALYYFALQWATAAMIRIMVLRLADAVDRARAARQAAELTREVADAVRGYGREQLALLHDTAASTLMMVGEKAGLPGARLARQARRDLDLLDRAGWTEPAPQLELVGALRECATHLSTPVTFSGPERLWLAGQAGAPVIAAAREAMTNVDRHAQATLLRVTVSDRAVQLADDGVGFDPDLPRVGHGVSESIIDRMRRAGGAATVRSDRSGGTVVELSWAGAAAGPEGAEQHGPAPEDTDPDRMIDRIRIRYGTALTGYALANLAFTVTRGDTGAAAGWPNAALGVAAALSVLAAIPGIWLRRWRPAGLAAAVLLAVTVAQPLLLAPGEVIGQSNWSQSGIGWCVLPLVLGLPIRRAAAVLIGYWSAGAVVAVVCWPTAATLVNIGLGTASILGVQLFALAFNDLARQAADDAQAETRARQRLLARERVGEALTAEYQRRYARLLGDIVPLLRRIAEGTGVDAELRRQARTQSQRLRALFDQAATFENPLMQRLREVVDRAEARGVQVTVDVAGDPPLFGAAAIEELVMPLQKVADRAQTFLRLVVAGSATEVDLSVVCDGAGADLAGESGAAELVCADGLLWIVVRRGGLPQGSQ